MNGSRDPGERPEPRTGGRRHRATRWLYARVLIVQLLTLLALWLLQATFGAG